jgi:hypothetical protein
MMRNRFAVKALLIAALAVVAGAALAQYGGRRGRGGYDDFGDDDRRGVPLWENDRKFDKDVFTFVRVVYNEGGYGGDWDRGYGRRGRRGWGGGWRTDWPDSDLNFSFRLQQLTSLKVNPNPVYMELTSDELFDYPFLYMIEPGDLYFSEPEVQALRKYLLAGGFLMVDDFWGDYQYENFYQQIKRVFPEREPKELDLDHEIFSIVYRLKEKPQVPSIDAAEDGRPYGITWEPRHGGDCRTVHYKGIFDDNGRMMVIICHNTDLGDGWEREGEDPWYFTEFAQKKSYPMGINIVVYAMTH